MQKKYVLTIDLGASNGRGIIFEYDGNHLKQVYEHRFQNGIITLKGTDYWDILHIFKNIKLIIKEASRKFPISSIGIDTWGLDFGLLDKNGILIENPVSYRDKRTQGVSDILHNELISKEDLHNMTGTQYLPNNSIYQIYYLLTKRPELIERVDKILMIPDLLTYFLTGEMHSEFTIASTTQLMSINEQKWNEKLLRKIGLSPSMLTDIIFPGEQAFSLNKEIQNELDINAIPVVTVASHDSASAIISVPVLEGENLFISSGTWPILGLERKEPIINEISFESNFTNEGGYGRTIRYARSLMGLWLIQECVRCWQEECIQLSYAEIDELAKAAEPFASLINPEEEVLQNKCKMLYEIANLCKKNKQRIPGKVGDYVRCIYESMALNYRRTIEILKKQVTEEFRFIYVVGGGSKAKFLNQCIADATGLVVIAGPGEATAYGNAFVQFSWNNDISSLPKYRDIINHMEAEIVRYEPKNTGVWDEAFLVFMGLN